MKNKIELIKMFEEKFLTKKWNFRKDQNPIEVRNFIFETIIPEVIKEIIPSKYGDNAHEYGEGYNNCIDEIKQKAKDLYGIEL